MFNKTRFQLINLLLNLINLCIKSPYGITS